MKGRRYALCQWLCLFGALILASTGRAAAPTFLRAEFRINIYSADCPRTSGALFENRQRPTAQLADGGRSPESHPVFEVPWFLRRAPPEAIAARRAHVAGCAP